MNLERYSKVTGYCICDPVQQKGHHVGHVYSEIMSKTVCKKYKENKRKFTLCKTCIIKTVPSICMNLVLLESLLNLQLDNTKISMFSKVDKMYSTFCCIGSQIRNIAFTSFRETRETGSVPCAVFMLHL